MEWSLIMAQTGAEEILMGCENLSDLVVGACSNIPEVTCKRIVVV